MEIEQEIIHHITNEVRLILVDDASGHGMEHVARVTQLAVAFAEQENANKAVVVLAALLHDVDDYKLFGQKNAGSLPNANAILDKYHMESVIKDKVLNIIHTMGYNKYLQGVRPKTLEGMIVSDADMCDAIGVSGILRTHAFALAHGNKFFDKKSSPMGINMSAEQYRAQTNTHSVQHFFDKLLKIPSILMTDAGRAEGLKRKAIMVHFLRELFVEEQADEWITYLDEFESTNN